MRVRAVRYEDQTPHERVADDAGARADVIRDRLADPDLDIEYTDLVETLKR